jgi:hypothetical protein
MRRLELQARRFLRRRLLSRSLLLAGWVLFRLHRHERAAALLARGTLIHPACFRTHLLLGRVQEARGRRAEAVMEYRVCYELAPRWFVNRMFTERFDEELALAAQMPPELPDLSPYVAPGYPVSGEWDDLLRADGGNALHGSDFSDGVELDRFRDLPPITADEVACTDLDALLARLSDLSEKGGALDS